MGILRRAAEGTQDSAQDPAGKPVEARSAGDWRAAEFLVKFRAEAPLRREQLRSSASKGRC
ncbi:MAG: hypothetical protein IPN17_01340 [Deltaproteobacteria bacterium]|nr:hypothetical protein [Deltaproteobacteria bacterium]